MQDATAGTLVPDPALVVVFVGTDINKRGIQPDIQLAADDMPPTDGPGFCRFVASKEAPSLFGSNSLLASKPVSSSARIPEWGSSGPAVPGDLVGALPSVQPGKDRFPSIIR